MSLQKINNNGDENFRKKIYLTNMEIILHY
jgi:hypothetical protein